MDLAIERGMRRAAHQLVRDTLRRAILTGKVRSGTRMVQADLAEQLQVSTTPVREALRDLATEGLITIDAHRGAVVRELSHDEVFEIYAIRKLLEPEAIRLAVERMTDDELEEAAALQARADVEEDPATWVELNREFHRLFMDASRSPRLSGILNNLQDSAAMYIAATVMQGQHRREDANDEHRRQLDAVRRRDVDAAVEVALAHIQQTVETVSRLDVEPSPEQEGD